MASVVLENLTKVYRPNTTAVDRLNLEIRDKEFLVFVGPSGCGKTSTLRMIAGLEEITSGTIRIGERVVNQVAAKDRDIAMVFQNFALYPHMTAWENMAFALERRKFSRAEIDLRVQEAAEILGIQDLLGRRPRELSGGQRQRVAVGKAIVRKPQVFLFDEPLSNLDAQLRTQMRVELSKLHARLQTTMIYVTHDQVEAMTMGDRIVVMKDGLIQQVADPITLYEHPRNRFVAGFIGHPAMNFLKGELQEENDRLVFAEDFLRLPLPEKTARTLRDRHKVEKQVILGIRPEDLHDPLHPPDRAATHEIQARVEVLEPIGSELTLYLTTGSHPLVARVPPRTPAEIDETKSLLVNLDKLHFFDPITGARLVE
ncbi:MAG: sn-glycerol-3-phosphate ABC transporter ATP-binding protein UgpC [Candidatus Sumerlaeia bacterium]|nr:sn-glycerol-3-phosphate ABC transporter ATP-binding protein UgpC [Candidatus Sumerlaeia bacterium]